MHKTDLNIETKAIADLVPAPYNPRTISSEALAGLRGSVERFGLVEPVVWNRRTGRVVGGHQRLKVLQVSRRTVSDGPAFTLFDGRRPRSFGSPPHRCDTARERPRSGVAGTAKTSR
jgi:hypothetical protein